MIDPDGSALMLTQSLGGSGPVGKNFDQSIDSFIASSFVVIAISPRAVPHSRP
jgi:hypothetical protein